jgi:hypothetical protein
LVKIWLRYCTFSARAKTCDGARILWRRAVAQRVQCSLIERHLCYIFTEFLFILSWQRRCRIQVKHRPKESFFSSGMLFQWTLRAPSLQIVFLQFRCRHRCLFALFLFPFGRPRGRPSFLLMVFFVSAFLFFPSTVSYSATNSTTKSVFKHRFCNKLSTPAPQRKCWRTRKFPPPTKWPHQMTSIWPDAASLVMSSLRKHNSEILEFDASCQRPYRSYTCDNPSKSRLLFKGGTVGHSNVSEDLPVMFLWWIVSFWRYASTFLLTESSLFSLQANFCLLGHVNRDYKAAAQLQSSTIVLDSTGEGFQ